MINAKKLLYKNKKRVGGKVDSSNINTDDRAIIQNYKYLKPMYRFGK